MQQSDRFERRLASPDDGHVAIPKIGKPVDARGMCDELRWKRRQDPGEVSEIGKTRGDHDIGREKALSIVQRDREAS